MFTHVKCPDIPQIERVDLDGYRHYVHGNRKYYSVTRVVNILSKSSIEEWKQRVGAIEARRVSDNSLNVGNALHLMIEAYLQNKKLPKFRNKRFEYPPSQILKTMKPELNKINNIVAQEVKLFSDNLGMAGTADCIAEYNGKLSIIDFKNSRRKKRRDYITSYFI